MRNDKYKTTYKHEYAGAHSLRMPRKTDSGTVAISRGCASDADLTSGEVRKRAETADGAAVCDGALPAQVNSEQATSAPWVEGEGSGRAWRCPDCGPGVRVDEDGCCVTCGADAAPPGSVRLARGWVALAGEASATAPFGSKCSACGQAIEIVYPDGRCGHCGGSEPPPAPPAPPAEPATEPSPPPDFDDETGPMTPVEVEPVPACPWPGCGSVGAQPCGEWCEESHAVYRRLAAEGFSGPLDLAARDEGADVADVCSRSREPAACRARAALWSWMHAGSTGLSFPEIARIFARDESTIRAGVARHEERTRSCTAAPAAADGIGGAR